MPLPNAHQGARKWGIANQWNNVSLIFPRWTRLSRINKGDGIGGGHRAAGIAACRVPKWAPGDLCEARNDLIVAREPNLCLLLFPSQF